MRPAFVFAGKSQAANTVDKFCGHYVVTPPLALPMMTQSVVANFAPHFAPSPPS